MTDFMIKPVEQCGQRVLTTAQLAEAYGTTSKVISNNFNRNIDRYIEGKHFYRLTGEAKREFCNRHQIEDGSKATDFYIWTERGSLLHAKSLNTDKAWEVYDFLMENYFRVQEIKTSYADTLLKMYQRQNELERRLNQLERRPALPENKPPEKNIRPTLCRTDFSLSVVMLLLIRHKEMK